MYFDPKLRGKINHRGEFNMKYCLAIMAPFKPVSFAILVVAFGIRRWRWLPNPVTRPRYVGRLGTTSNVTSSTTPSPIHHLPTPPSNFAPRYFTISPPARTIAASAPDHHFRNLDISEKAPPTVIFPSNPSTEPSKMSRCVPLSSSDCTDAFWRTPNSRQETAHSVLAR